MLEFHINEYLSLKLEQGKTNIYVKGNLFNQCKFLLLNIPIHQVESIEEIESIDEAAEKLDKSMEDSKIKFRISPKEEFWAHCSNLQVWFEKNYDTRLLHHSLAFYLLEALVKAGDIQAKKVLKEEIAKRLSSGVKSVVEYLFNEDFVGYYLNKEELRGAILDEHELNLLYELEDELGYELEYCYNAAEPNTYYVEDKKIVKINLKENELKKFPYTILKFKKIKKNGKDYTLGLK